MGATLDIQRQQRMDLLDQQLLLAQYNEAQRNARHQPQVDTHTHLHTLTQKFTVKHRPFILHPFFSSCAIILVFIVFKRIALCVCVGWVVPVDQAVPIPEAQRTEPTPDAAPPSGSDTSVHTTTITRKLPCCRGAGGVWHVCLFVCVCFSFAFCC